MSKILIVEDEKNLLNALKIKLEREGYEVITASDGETALNSIREDRPDAILLDVVLPKKTGLEILEEMQNDPKFGSIPVIIISNSGRPIEIEQVKKLGVKDILVKANFTPQEVIEKLKHWAPAPARPPKNFAEDQTNQGLIFLVEDDTFLRTLLTDKLVKEGFLVEGAGGGQEALDLLEKVNPTLIILDLLMPVIDGFQVLEVIRKNDRLKNTPVLVLSNLGEQEHIDRARSLGADDYLVKAYFTLNEITQKIREIISKKYL
ncbi:MAG: response regulator [Candidatus Sungbacteria bacterium]|nr:response regulator [Candidatus Sungbacteria bacterium]